MNWKIKLEHGTALRKAIEDEDPNEILSILVEAYKYLEKKLKLDLSRYIEDVIMEIECEAFDDETVDYHLGEFYSFCDAQKVWVEL